jgi:uncharacterized protein YeaO (DUF488 family)
LIRVKRIYEPPSAEDGFRVLVDRLWPRGLKKTAAAVDLWLKDIAPSTGLRTWFAHDPAKWPEFRKRYHDELEHQGEAVALLDRKRTEGTVTLLFSARDPLHNDAVVLKEYLQGRHHRRRRSTGSPRPSSGSRRPVRRRKE